MHLLSQSSYRLGTWTWVSRVLFWGSFIGCYQDISQDWVLIWKLNWERSLFQTHVGKIELLEGCWTKGLRSFLAIGRRLPSVSFPGEPLQHSSSLYENMQSTSNREGLLARWKIMILYNLLKEGNYLLREVGEAKHPMAPISLMLWVSTYCAPPSAHTGTQSLYVSPVVYS